MMVAKAASSALIPKLVDDWYKGCGGLVAAPNPPAPSKPCSVPQSTVPDGWKPATLPANLQDFSSNHQASDKLYLDVPAQYCRMCHISRPSLPFNVQDFQSFAARFGLIRSNVFLSTTPEMPFAQLTNQLFFSAPHAPSELKLLVNYCTNHKADLVNHC